MQPEQETAEAKRGKAEEGKGYLVDVQLEAELAAALLDDGRANVGGHDEQRVLEVHGAALAVRQATVLQNLSASTDDAQVRNACAVSKPAGCCPREGPCNLWAHVLQYAMEHELLPCEHAHVGLLCESTGNNFDNHSMNVHPMG